MLFGVVSRMDEFLSSYASQLGAILQRHGAAHCTNNRNVWCICVKTAKAIEMPSGIVTRVSF